MQSRAPPLKDESNADNSEADGSYSFEALVTGFKNNLRGVEQLTREDNKTRRA